MEPTSTPLDLLSHSAVRNRRTFRFVVAQCRQDSPYISWLGGAIAVRLGRTFSRLGGGSLAGFRARCAARAWIFLRPGCVILVSRRGRRPVYILQTLPIRQPKKTAS